VLESPADSAGGCIKPDGESGDRTRGAAVPGAGSLTRKLSGAPSFKSFEIRGAGRAGVRFVSGFEVLAESASFSSAAGAGTTTGSGTAVVTAAAAGTAAGAAGSGTSLAVKAKPAVAPALVRWMDPAAKLTVASAVAGAAKPAGPSVAVDSRRRLRAPATRGVVVHRSPFPKAAQATQARANPAVVEKYRSSAPSAHCFQWPEAPPEGPDADCPPPRAIQLSSSSEDRTLPSAFPLSMPQFSLGKTLARHGCAWERGERF
jgi:hypothetical protein